jgi:hypothetical protein
MVRSTILTGRRGFRLQNKTDARFRSVGLKNSVNAYFNTAS